MRPLSKDGHSTPLTKQGWVHEDPSTNNKVNVLKEYKSEPCVFLLAHSIRGVNVGGSDILVYLDGLVPASCGDNVGSVNPTQTLDGCIVLCELCGLTSRHIKEFSCVVCSSRCELASILVMSLVVVFAPSA